jgi:hypothetical protein
MAGPVDRCGREEGKEAHAMSRSVSCGCLAGTVYRLTVLPWTALRPSYIPYASLCPRAKHNTEA